MSDEDKRVAREEEEMMRMLKGMEIRQKEEEEEMARRFDERKRQLWAVSRDIVARVMLRVIRISTLQLRWSRRRRRRCELLPKQQCGGSKRRMLRGLLPLRRKPRPEEQRQRDWRRSRWRRRLEQERRKRPPNREPGRNERKWKREIRPLPLEG